MRASLAGATLIFLAAACAQAQPAASSLVDLFEKACLETQGDREPFVALAERSAWPLAASAPTEGEWSVSYRSDSGIVALSGRGSTQVHPDTALPGGGRGTAYTSPQVNCSVTGIARTSPADAVREFAETRSLPAFPARRSPQLPADVEMGHWGRPDRLLLTYFYQASTGRTQIAATFAPN